MYISKSYVTLNMNNIGTLICISIRVTRTILVFILFSEGSAVKRSKMDIFFIFEIQNQRSILESRVSESIESFVIKSHSATSKRDHLKNTFLKAACKTEKMSYV